MSVTVTPWWSGAESAAPRLPPPLIYSNHPARCHISCPPRHEDDLQCCESSVCPVFTTTLRVIFLRVFALGLKRKWNVYAILFLQFLCEPMRAKRRQTSRRAVMSPKLTPNQSLRKQCLKKSASIERNRADIRRGAPGEKIVARTPCGLGYSIIFDYSDYVAPWWNNQRL